MSKKSKISRIIFLALAAILIAFIIVCVRNKVVAEWYMQTIYPIVACILSNISGLLSFSLYDTFLVIYILAILVSIVLLIIGKLRFLKWIKYLITSVIVIIIWFYMSWGISYSRSDYYERTNTPKQTFDSINFKNFLQTYVEELNSSYQHDYIFNLEDVDKAIEESYSKHIQNLAIKYPNGKRRTKLMLFENLMTKSGVTGYFGPFFNEVHVNFSSLPMDLPYTIAHEKAHQLGIASEAECNLYAYIVCSESDNKQLNYSAYFSVMGYMLNNTSKLLPNEYRNVVNTINQGVIDDYNRNIDHWGGSIDTTISNAQSKIYDTYLKTNKIQSGMKNYSEMVELLVSWHINKNNK